MKKIEEKIAWVLVFVVAFIVVAALFAYLLAVIHTERQMPAEQIGEPVMLGFLFVPLSIVSAIMLFKEALYQVTRTKIMYQVDGAFCFFSWPLSEQYLWHLRQQALLLYFK